MGRRKLTMEFINNPKKRKSTLEKRGKTLKEKARELSILCDVPLCVIIYPGPDSEPETYPENQGEVRSLINRYMSIPMEVRSNAKRSENLEDDLQCNKRRKIDGDCQVSNANYPTAIDGFSREELVELVSNLDYKLNYVAERIGYLKGSFGNYNQISGFEVVPQGFMETGVYHDDVLQEGSFGNCNLSFDDDQVLVGSLDDNYDGNAAFSQMGDDSFDPNVFTGSDFYCDDQVDSLISVLYGNAAFSGDNVGF